MIKLITILFLCISLQSNAADIKYLFYHVNKKVEWRHDGISENAKRGQFLANNQSITIGELSEIMLVQQDGQSMLLEKPGVYSFTQIKKLFSQVKKSSNAGFLSYVFDKFLTSGDREEKQKVSAAVLRGKQAMLLPADSSFIFSKAPIIQWKPEQKNIPYRIILKINQATFDTVIRSTTSFVIPEKLLVEPNAKRIEWVASPSDSKLPQQHPFLYLIPAKADQKLIRQQLQLLKNNYSKNQPLLKIMQKDLFERWLELYQLQ